MTTHINRRTALAGAAAGTLIPAAGLANAALTRDSAAEPDPFVSAFCRYAEAEEAYGRACKATASLPIEEHEKEVSALCTAECDAMLEMAQTVPTTTLGLYMAIRALLPAFGERRSGGGGNVFSFDDMVVHDDWANGAGEALLRSLFAGAERILNNNEPEDV